MLAAETDGDSGGLGETVPAETEVAAAADGDHGSNNEAIQDETEMAASADDSDCWGNPNGQYARCTGVLAKKPSHDAGEAYPGDTEMMDGEANPGDALKATRAANAIQLSVINEGINRLRAKDEEFNRLLAKDAPAQAPAGDATDAVEPNSGNTTIPVDGSVSAEEEINRKNFIAFKSMVAEKVVRVPTTQDALMSLNSDSACDATQSLTHIHVLPGGMHTDTRCLKV